MRTAAGTSIVSVLTILVGITAAAGLFLACGSSADRTSDDSSARGGPSFGDNGDRDSNATSSCATAEATAVKPPVDFIFVVDESGTMGEETASLTRNINGLSALLQRSGLDYRVVMIAATEASAFAVCVPPPLAAANCRSNGNVFRAVPAFVGSGDGLKWTLETLKATSGPLAWRDFIRQDSLKVLVPITDDRAFVDCGTPLRTCTATWFDASLISTGGTAFGDNNKRKYVAFPIIGANAYPAETKCGTAVNNGPEYIELAKLTGGKWFPVCTPDFGSLLTEIGTTVNASVSCELAIPTVAVQDLDPNRVNVKIKKADGSTVEILKDDKNCVSGADGWQYSADGKNVVLCGATCEGMKHNPDDRVTVEFGCQTRVR
jgi:hypothetical protein